MSQTAILTTPLSFSTHVETLPALHNMLRPHLNGTHTTEAQLLLRAPSYLPHHLTRLHWPAIKSLLTRWADDAATNTSTHLNALFHGTDVCELGYKITDVLLPSVSLPSRHRVGRSLDKLTDRVQALLERAPPASRFGDGNDEANLRGLQWVFAVRMGEKVRRSLVAYGICSDWQVVPTRENLTWQGALNQALVSFVERVGGEGGMLQSNGGGKGAFARLMEMEPVWVADRERCVWRLELDTLLVEVGVRGSEVVDEARLVPTGFELDEGVACVRVEDWMRGTRSVEGGWEMLV